MKGEAQRERIRQIMSGVLEIDPDAINDRATPEDVARWDSLNHLRLISALEDAFGISFTTREASGIDSFEKIVSAVESKD